MEKNIINVLQNIKPYVTDQRLSDVLQAAYPNTSLATTYFVYSTFPSIYGHFCCAEYSEQALNFLLRHINDPLAPKLIGTFLMHSYVFQDRFIHLFFHSIDPQQFSTNISDIKYTFLDTLRKCVSCLTQQQITIANEIIHSDRIRAKEAIFDEFLYPFVKLWNNHPLYSTTNTIIQLSSPENPNDFKSIKITNLIINMLNDIVSNDLCHEVFNIFNTRIYSVLPEIQQIIFYGGLDFQFSVADITIATKLYQSVRKKMDNPNATNTTFIEDAFHLKSFNIAIIPKSRPPEPTETSKEFTLKKFQDNKRAHEFLIEHSHGLKEIEIMLTSLQHILQLVCDNYSISQMLSFEDTYPIKFLKTQVEYLSLNLLDIFVKPSKLLFDYVERQTSVGFPNNQLTAISSNIEELLESGKQLHETIVYAAINIQNKWANMFNNDKTNKVKVMLSVAKNNSFMPKMEFYTNIFKDITFSLLLADISKIAIPFQGITSKNRVDFLLSLVDACSTVTPYVLSANNIDINDPIISIRIPMLKDIGNILILAENGFKALFEKNLEMFFIGEKIRLFLEIERRIGPEFKNVKDNSNNNLAYYQKIISPLLQYNEPLYFRATLIQTLCVIKELYTDKFQRIPNLNTIKNPISEEIFEKFENLRKWFGISDRFYREFTNN
ncbi:hypothetical protein GPJ56_009949 [Histomonas meleagridis]|uniref:uncharacterized protein n=1 Tax=Histomonas meleagridis TaxID=135588 RepID=UPI0035593C55|nr:hypothetical protein GPJ56_009949 [Histomonas meleagridis]KAH0802744.1 hypothetical protein GO595_004251 [Histomonas meleagridis]